MPGEFLEAGADRVDGPATEEALGRFVGEVLGRAAGVDDPRVAESSGRWQAVRDADDDERAFCRVAGRMGLDPYDDSETPEDLALFIEKAVESPDDPLVRDLTEVARPDRVRGQWSWVATAKRDFELSPFPTGRPLMSPWEYDSPSNFGYDLAKKVRAAAGVGGGRVGSVYDVMRTVLGQPVRVEERNHIPGHEVLKLVGQSLSGEVLTVGPVHPRPSSERFRSARGFYHVLGGAARGPRLVTNGFSWDQKASRAFAAEFLAPRERLAERFRHPGAEAPDAEALGREFEVSPQLIALQLRNAGVSWPYD